MSEEREMVTVQSEDFFRVGLKAMAGEPWYIRFLHNGNQQKFWEAWGVGSNTMTTRYGVVGFEGISGEKEYKLLKSKVKDKRKKEYVLDCDAMKDIYLGAIVAPEVPAPEAAPEPSMEPAPVVVEAPVELIGAAKLKWLAKQRKKSSDW